MKKIDKIFQQTLWQREYVNGEQAHEKMLNIISDQGNAI